MTISIAYRTSGTSGGSVAAAMLTSGALALSMLAPAGAATADIAATAVTSGSGALQEVVVTATKRKESIQKVPISMNAVSGEQLSQMHVENVMDLGQAVPGLQLRTEWGVTDPVAYIRGVGNNSFVATSIAAVGFYADGAYIGENIAQGLQLFDIDRVEVLKGPQGTLFGQNTTGGAINVITRKPTFGGQPNGQLTITAGEFGTLNATGAFGGVISPTLAYRVAVNRQSDRGVYRNINPNFTGDRNIDRTDLTAVRAELLWKPADSFSALLNLHWARDHGGLVINQAGWLPNATGSNCPAGAIPGALHNGCTDPFGFGLAQPRGFFQTNEALAGQEHLKTYGASAELTWRLGDYTLTSLSAWDKADMVRLHDSDGTSLAILHSTFIPDTSYWSQELRLTSNYQGPLNWIVGANYYGDRDDSFTFYDYPDLAGEGIAQAMHQRTASIAGFGEANLKFADRWTFTVGARETSDKRAANIQTWLANGYGLITPPAVPGSVLPAVPPNAPVTQPMAQAAFIAPLIPFTYLQKTWHQWSGRVSLKYEIDDDKLVYATLSHGFKGGEFNGAAIISQAQEVSLSNPEFLNNYELGFKSTWRQRLRLNVATFYMQYKDQQVMAYPTADAVFPKLENIGASRIKGAEFDLQARPGAGFDLGLGGTYLDTRVTRLSDPVLGSLAGNQLNDAPKFSFNGHIGYQHSLPRGDLSLQVQGEWVGRRYFQIENQPGLFGAAYGLMDVRAAYDFPGRKLEIGVFAKNVLNHGYAESGYDLHSFGSNVFQMGRPRLVAADITYRFD